MRNHSLHFKAVAIGVLLFSALHIYSQPSSKFSSDTARINHLNRESFRLRDENSDSCAALAHLAIQLSEKISYLPGLGDGYTRLGIVEKNKGNYVTAVNFYKKSLSYRIQIGDPDLIGRVYSNIGVAYTKQALYDSAIHYLMKSLNIAEQLGQKSFETDRLMNLGIAYEKNEDFDLSLDYYQKALSLYWELHIAGGIMQSHVNIGSVLHSKKMYRESVEASKLGLDEARNLKDSKNQMRALGNLALAYKELGKLDSAIYYTHEIIAKKNTEQNKQSLAISLSNLGIMFGEKNKMDSALFYLEESQKLAKEVGDLKLVADNYASLAAIHSSRNEFDQAYRNQKEFILYHDSVFNESKTNAIAEMQTKYETEKKEKENQLLANRNEIQQLIINREHVVRNSLIGSTLLLFVIGLLLFNRFRLKQRHRRETERMSISNDLHDEVGSTLSSIGIYSGHASSLLGQQKFDEAKNILEEISQSSQQMIGEMNDIIWSVNPRNDSFLQMINRLQSFAENIAAPKRIKVHLAMGDALKGVVLPMSHRKNLYLICKEAINNAVKYSEGSNLTVNFKKEGKKLIAEILDDGKGFDVVNVQPGNGLNSMRMRADDLHAEFSIESHNNSGTHVKVKMSVS